jgi:hypothetical protein
MADTVTAAYKRYRAHGGGLDRHKHLGSRQPSLNLRHPLLHPQNLPHEPLPPRLVLGGRGVEFGLVGG